MTALGQVTEIGVLNTNNKVYEVALDNNILECHFMSPKHDTYGFTEGLAMTVTFDLSEIGGGCVPGNHVINKALAYGFKQLYKTECLDHRFENPNDIEVAATLEIIVSPDDRPFISEGKGQVAIGKMSKMQLEKRIADASAALEALQAKN